MTDYSKLKVTELKDLLKERGIPSTGLSRKQQIIDALEARDEAEVSDDVPGDDAAKKDEEADEKVVADTAATETKTPSEPQPTVLEHDQPVSTEPSALATPQQTSPPPDDASSDTRKRKRRSPTPPLSAESVNKKLKSAEEEPVKLPEDEVIEDAPAPVETAADESEKTIQPYGSSDDVMDVKEDILSSDAPATSIPAAVETAPLKPPDAMDLDTPPTGAVHPATRALYIRDLIRPLQPAQVQDHLTSLAISPSNPTPAAIEAFHLDALRSHAFALFATLSDAARVRAKLHNTVWPEEPTRKPLFVDFVPEEKVQEWIDTELSSGTSRRDAKRWEVVYDVSDEDGGVKARLMEVTSNTAMTGMGRQPSFSQQAAPLGPASSTGMGVGMPNAPLGPRSSTFQPRRPSETALPPPPTRSPTSSRAKLPTPAPVVNNPTFSLLDSRFRSTTAKPKLYYLPKDKQLANDRLDELERQTSRDWTGGTRADWNAQLKRYTFEDGDRLVDGGPDRGNFGVPTRGRGGYRGSGGGYRGGGGGGYRPRY